jgi:hypothetical protein
MELEIKLLQIGHQKHNQGSELQASEQSHPGLLFHESTNGLSTTPDLHKARKAR